MLSAMSIGAIVSSFDYNRPLASSFLVTAPAPISSLLFSIVIKSVLAGDGHSLDTLSSVLVFRRVDPMSCARTSWDRRSSSFRPTSAGRRTDAAQPSERMISR
jgi:hypothetical protein